MTHIDIGLDRILYFHLMVSVCSMSWLLQLWHDLVLWMFGIENLESIRVHWGHWKMEKLASIKHGESINLAVFSLLECFVVSRLWWARQVCKSNLGPLVTIQENTQIFEWRKIHHLLNNNLLKYAVKRVQWSFVIEATVKTNLEAVSWISYSNLERGWNKIKIERFEDHLFLYVNWILSKNKITEFWIHE